LDWGGVPWFDAGEVERLVVGVGGGAWREVRAVRMGGDSAGEAGGGQGVEGGWRVGGVSVRCVGLRGWGRLGSWWGEVGWGRTVGGLGGRGAFGPEESGGLLSVL